MQTKGINELHNVNFNSTGKQIVCCSTDYFNILDVETGNIVKNIEFHLKGVKGDAKFS